MFVEVDKWNATRTHTEAGYAVATTTRRPVRGQKSSTTAPINRWRALSYTRAKIKV